ncbi:hypothetical protein GCM10023149_54570 [Mucilaginibacter gynuensis]|uniref:Uncharacterized protein n=1 Tax=Mucilaginibacter gynuensis TaxID=1302236 RepID=A0ABP8HNU7_9SPHI
MKNFTTDAEGVDFEFITMNIRKLQLFQVYTTYNNARVRFHMQIADDGNFYITDRPVCPEEYLRMEPMLNKAIQIYGKVEYVPPVPIESATPVEPDTV